MYSCIFVVLLFSLFQGSKSLTVEDGAAVKNALGQLFMNSPREGSHWLPSKVLRLAFHDCTTFRVGGGGGCHSVLSQSCVSLDEDAQCERDDPENGGLDTPMGALETILEQFPVMSRADFWQLAANVAIEHAGGPNLEFAWGRVDFPAEGGFIGRVPVADFTFEDIRDALGPQGAGLTDEEIVAVQGAHTLGFLHEDVSGRKGTWDRTPTGWDTEYYKGLERVLTFLWPEKGQLGDRHLIFTKQLMLPTDQESMRKYPNLVKNFARNRGQWEAAFAAGWKKIQMAGNPDILQVVPLAPLDPQFVRKGRRNGGFKPFQTFKHVHKTVVKHVKHVAGQIHSHVKKTVNRVHKHIQGAHKRMKSFFGFATGSESEAEQSENVSENASTNGGRSVSGMAIASIVLGVVALVVVIGVTIFLVVTRS